MFSVFFQGHFYYKADEICILIHFFPFFKIKCCQHVSVQDSDSADEMGQSSLNTESNAAICNPQAPRVVESYHCNLIKKKSFIQCRILKHYLANDMCYSCHLREKYL